MARVRTGWNRCQDLDDGSELAVTFRDLFPVPSRFQREPVPESEPLSGLARLESLSKQTAIVPRLPLSEETAAVARALLMPPASVGGDDTDIAVREDARDAAVGEDASDAAARRDADETPRVSLP